MEIVLPIELPPCIVDINKSKLLDKYFNFFINQQIKTHHYDVCSFIQIKKLFGLKKKSEQEKFVKDNDFIISSSDIINLIYHCYSLELSHTVKEVQWQTEQGKRTLENSNKKIFAKDKSILLFKDLNAGFKDRKITTVHIFKSISEKKWHIFYFSQNDILIVNPNNHWVNGPHIHYISYLFYPENSIDNILDRLISQRETKGFSSHIRYNHPNIIGPSINDILIYGKPHILYDNIKNGKISICSPDSILVGYKK